MVCRVSDPENEVSKIFDNEDRETYETETIKIETTRYSRPKVKKQIDLDSLDMGDDE